MPAATWKCLAALKVNSHVFNFKVWFGSFDEIMFVFFSFFFFFNPSIPVTQGVLWALTFLMPFQETEGKQHLSFLPNDHISGCSTSVDQQGSVCNCGHIISPSYCFWRVSTLSILLLPPHLLVSALILETTGRRFSLLILSPSSISPLSPSPPLFCPLGNHRGRRSQFFFCLSSDLNLFPSTSSGLFVS